MTDRLIEQLVAELVPQSPLRNAMLWACGAALLTALVAAVLALMGLRQDYAAAMDSGAFFWKPGIFLLVLLGSLVVTTTISRPHGRVKTYHLVPWVIALSLLIWQGVSQIRHLPLDALTQSLTDGSALYCFSVITMGGAFVLLVFWKFWLTKTASLHPVLLGLCAGISAGAMAAAAYTLHCNHDSALYVFAYYMLPVAGLGILGGVLGKKFLRW